jgi:tRNA-splicing ligase RtcB
MYTYKPNEAMVPVKIWMEQNTLEEGAITQIENCAKLPFIFHHLAVMPDCHTGYGVTIGSVLATKGVVLPFAVGSDIGCGMCAVKTSLKEIDVKILKKIMGKIREVIPLGKEHQKDAQDKSLMPSCEAYAVCSKYPDSERYPVVSKEYQSALHQLGTLGGGNHFVDILKGSDGHIWIMLHSGSRNLGKKVADYHNKIAVEMNEKWCSSIPKNWQLAFLIIDSEQGQTYIREMNYCVEFALANRKLMMNRIVDIFYEEFPLERIAAGLDEEMINIAHNYATMENHFGKNVMIHRKGATLARIDTIGIIPGSMGSASYIVKGKGNPDSFMSCSHGAGRAMSRTKAENDLVFADEVKKLTDKGIVHGLRNQDDLDESTGAYKDIESVMEQQKDLVDILVKLEPIAVINK